MKNRLAIIDLGTGSVKLLISDIQKNGEQKQLHAERIECRPGKGILENSGHISGKTLAENIRVLKYFISQAKMLGAKQIRIISTEVLRKAKNKEKVLDKIAEEVGIRPVVISREKEADLFWKGVTADFPENMELAAIDIGGRSVQFMHGTKKEMRGYKLLDTGVFHLKETLKTGDPFSKKDILNIEKAVLDELEDIRVLFSPETPFIHGSSSVIDFYQEARLPLAPFGKSKSHPFQVDLKNTRKFYQRTQKMTIKERMLLSPSLPGFASAAVIGLANVLMIAQKTGLKFELPSNNNITQGIAMAVINGEL